MTIRLGLVTPWACKCGIYTYSKDLASALADQNVEVFIVRLSRFGQKTPELIQDTAERVPFKNIDLVHVQHEYGLYQNLEQVFYSHLRRGAKPIVTTMHAVGSWDTDTMIAGISAKVIVHNKFCLSRFPFENTVIIPHGGTPMEATPREQAKSAMGIDPRLPIVGYLGFISNYKGLESLIQAMTKIKAGLLICGGWHIETKENEYIARLKDWADKLLPNRIKWTGFVSDEKLADAYGAMDVLVYPARFATESGALTHALSYGKAIIASNLEPFKEKEPALMTFKDVEDLTQKIQLLLDNKSQREELEQQAREYAQNIAWSPNIAQKHINLYKELL